MNHIPTTNVEIMRAKYVVIGSFELEPQGLIRIPQKVDVEYRAVIDTGSSEVVAAVGAVLKEEEQ